MSFFEVAEKSRVLHPISPHEHRYSHSHSSEHYYHSDNENCKTMSYSNYRLQASACELCNFQPSPYDISAVWCYQVVITKGLHTVCLHRICDWRIFRPFVQMYSAPLSSLAPYCSPFALAYHLIFLCILLCVCEIVTKLHIQDFRSAHPTSTVIRKHMRANTITRPTTRTARRRVIPKTARKQAIRTAVCLTSCAFSVIG